MKETLLVSLIVTIRVDEWKREKEDVRNITSFAYLRLRRSHVSFVLWLRLGPYSARLSTAGL